MTPRGVEHRLSLADLGAAADRGRTDLKLTQQDLGDRCGLHRTFVGSVERGERNVSVLNLRQLARALRVPVADLLAGL